MAKTNNLINEVFKDFNGEIGKRSKELTFLNSLSKNSWKLSIKGVPNKLLCINISSLIASLK